MPKSVIFVDSRVADYQSLMDSFVEPAEVFVLDGESDGLAQIAAYLQGRTGIDAIHVISHGSMGALYLGGTVLNSSNVALHGSQLASIGGALTETGDILLYGCNVAQGDVGLQFITSLAQYTGADVAGSSDATGAAGLGGDWVLEQAAGSIEAVALLGSGITGLLATNTAPTFTFMSTAGKMTGFSGFATSVALQSDGKIVVAGGNNGKYFVVDRYNTDGSHDPTFNAAYTAFGGNFNYDISASGVIVQADGKIVAAGSTKTAAPNSLENFALARYNADGSLDPTFGDSGKVTTDFGSLDFGNDILIQPDGKIVVAGSSGNNFAIARYNSNGSLDASFDGDGKVTTPVGTNDSGKSVAIQTDGKIVVAGYTGYSNVSPYVDFALTRYNADGGLDPTFGDSGKVTTDIGYLDFCWDILIQSDGKIVVAGSSGNNFAIARYNSNGSLDASFDGDGKVITDFDSSDGGSSVTIQTDGKIVVAGSSYGNFAIARYNVDGSLDTTFDGDGRVESDFGNNDSSNGIAIQIDGKIVVVGRSSGSSILGSFTNAALARYNTDGSPDLSFGSRSQLPLYTGASAVKLDTAVELFDRELYTLKNCNGATLALSRHGGANVGDVFSATVGGHLTALVSGNYFSNYGVALGRVTSNAAGILTLTFSSNATIDEINSVLRQIAYANAENVPPATVQIDWTFSDGNIGEQGTGGALTVTGTSQVNITARNAAPTLTSPLPDTTAIANLPFSLTLPANAFTDANAGEILVYGFDMANGSILPPWLHFNPATRTLFGTPGAIDLGSFDIRVTAKDLSNASVSDTFRLTVSNQDSGSDGNDTLTGTSGPESIYGNGGDDRIIIGGGTGDTVSGGTGIDTVVFTNDSGDYLVSKNPSTGSYEVISKTGAIDYVDVDVEKMAFRDITMDAASYKYYGTADPVLAGSVSSVYRFFNTNDNAFFYTNSVAERDAVLANSDVSHNNIGEWPYVYQGSSFEAAHTYAGAVPVERFYNTVTHHHFFTSSATETATVKANSASGAWPFVYEGVSFNVYASDPNPNSVGQEIAVERFYSATLNRHWFTADQTEIAQIRLTGLWVDEGIGFWGEKPGA